MYLSDSPALAAENVPPVPLPLGDPPDFVARLRMAGPLAWIGGAISLAMLAAALWELRRLDAREIVAAIPSSPFFWVLFAASYLAAPFADWVIFRRLWKLPAAGFVALLRKNIGNNLLLGYIGELYFYTWARSRADVPGAPFGAIKDVAVLSAVVGNLVTLAMLALAYPMVSEMHPGVRGSTLAVSIGVVLVTTTLIMVLRRRLFGLEPKELRFIALVHFLRIAASTGILAVMWHVALPGQAVGLWLLLATMRLLITRLPLVPNKDLVFAGLAVFVMGHEVEVSALITMIATLTLVAHVLLGALLAASDIAARART